MIALLDYGAGNLRSVHKALRFLNANVRLVTEPAGLKEAHAVVLPGVGAFDDCLNALRKQELLAAVNLILGQPLVPIPSQSPSASPTQPSP